MLPLDPNIAHAQLARTADLVEGLAGLIQRIADTVPDSGSGFADLAAAGRALADQARTAADAADHCVATANGLAPHAANGPLVCAELLLAAKCGPDAAFLDRGDRASATTSR